MKTNRAILDEFGEKLINKCFDPAYGNLASLKLKENPPLIFEEYSSLFKKLDEKDFKTLQNYLRESLGGMLFNVLRLFEEEEKLKLFYEEDGKQLNLVGISEDLKSEPIIENGWIERFSDELKNE